MVSVWEMINSDCASILHGGISLVEEMRLSTSVVWRVVSCATLEGSFTNLFPLTHTRTHARTHTHKRSFYTERNSVQCTYCMCVPQYLHYFCHLHRDNEHKISVRKVKGFKGFIK